MEAHHLYYIIGAVILCTAPVLLLAIAHVETTSSGQKQEFEFSSKDMWRQLREENTHIASLSQLLRRAGLFNTEQQVNAISISLIAIITSAICLGIYTYFKGSPATTILLTITLGFVLLVYLAYFFLKKIAEDRQEKLNQETLILVQTTRMLWRVGLSLPKTLAIICDQLRNLAPTCSQELQLAVNKIESGQSQEESLYELIGCTNAEGFKEYLIVVRQQAITGGSIDKALDELYKLLQNRRKLDLQEEVTKMSGKMSLVMMVFLFPALLIVVAGPALMSVSSVMSNIGN
ncbi:type II secretion system F family protein [Zhongshania sp.]|jgi:tight adherence protein C|uniref:type II secretion system F family protein n=1 Tax=Zhongshania sp. TaxID=1971902 RepID=UPI001B5157AB|nr:type II secretion system F family protein [Zhongshania sp.]MBQ0794700.1 type II secretion system F family protein [Zhongshania sp.]|tara:strand:+ start:538 stop:1407 length:870 start_codon:yes stop_codon:yes gene_type:complete